MADLTRSESLLALSREHEEIEAELIAGGGEMTTDLMARWERACSTLVQKVDSFAVYHKSLLGRVEAAKELAKAVAARAKMLERHDERLLAYADMALGERKKLSGDVFSINRRSNPPAVEIENEDLVRATCPDCLELRPLDGSYEIVTNEDGTQEVMVVRIDKAKLKAAIEAGQPVAGARITRGERIEIR